METEHDYKIPNTSVWVIIRREWVDKLKELEDWLEDYKREYDDTSLYVYTYKVDKDWDKIKLRHEIPFDVVNPMIQDYVRKGNNMSQQQVIDKYKLKDKVWNALKSALNLNKYSWVCNEIYLKILEEKGWHIAMEEYVEETAFRTVQDKYREIEVRKFHEAKQREIDKALGILKWRDAWLDRLGKYLETYKPIEVRFTPTKIQNNDVYDVWISDFHFGYKSQEVAMRLHRATNYILNRPEKIINIMCLWDLVENIVATGEMHIWQQQSQDMFWFDLMMFTVHQLETMLFELWKAGKIVSFFWLAGNHDRLAKNHWEDIQEIGARAMYELLRRWLNNTEVRVEYLVEKTNVVDTKQARYTVNHWEEWFANKAQKNPEKILRDHWHKDKPNVIMYWHLHKIDIMETNNATVVGLPWLAARWKYAERLDLYSEPWIVGIKLNQYGTVDLDIKRF